MKHYTIYDYRNRDVLYEDYFPNFKSCVETAAEEAVNLSYADLRHQDLSNSNLDDARLMYADFSCSNLTGANLSEANLRSCVFDNAALFNACFAYSDLQNANFCGASFGGTDITGTNISFAAFSNLSWAGLDFSNVRLMKDCEFSTGGQIVETLSKPPVVIRGLGKKPLIILGDKMCYGDKQIECGSIHARVKQILSTTNNGIEKTNRSTQG